MRLRLPLLALCLLLAPACSSDEGEEGASDETTEEGAEGEDGEDGEEEEDEEYVPDPRTLVDVKASVIGSVADHVVSSGAVESEAQADLVPEASGTVTAIHVEEGDLVRRGKVLAVIDNASLDASLARAQAELATAERTLSETRTLHGQGAVSDRDLDEAEAAVTAARTSLTEASKTQGQTRLVTPIDGTVAVRELRYGEVAGGARAFQIVDLTRLQVVVSLPERDLPRLAVGQAATLSSVYDEALAVPGVIQRIAPTIDPTTGTVKVTVALQQDELLLRPGQYVSVRIEVDRHDEVLTVSRRAIVYEEGRPHVFRVAIEEEPEEEKPDEEEGEDEEREEPGFLAKLFGGGEGEGGDTAEEEEEIPGPYRIARKIEIELGYVDQEVAEVMEGLELGDEVVVRGHMALRDGARVRYTEDPKLGDDPDDPEDADADAEDGEKAEKAQDGEEQAEAAG